ncbi:hypothetical protein T8K17_02260 [Thalassobaculum sp. OXR-137]|uniref:hypothetical protein n=1 Tax=Thalassobaculum sp. OXR-137 TaxID=3100173 RepID=UPI002AC97A44|nr:hypothetical protein [Thalassobaculum sp. OXR-137]WPZ34976.1 hypothetical protein T8K17_02260 [Thalassobaculum sp. OXR-137]
MTDSADSSSPPPDAGDLARRFMDLWQSQVQAMATDPEVTDAMRRWTALWTGQGFAAPPARPMADGLQPGYGPGAAAASSSAAASPYSAGHDGDSERYRKQQGRPTAGAAPAAPVSERGGDDLALILRELRRLEERIARLEERLERDGGEPEGPARRPGGGKSRSGRRS